MKRLLVIFWVPYLILGGSLAAFIAFTPCARPRESFDRVLAGMSEPEVRAVLGSPGIVRQDAPDRKTYFYGGVPNGRWCTMEVFFNVSGRVTGTLHDH